MPNVTGLAMSQAAGLNEIGFQQFSAELIIDTFHALAAANCVELPSEPYLVEISSKECPGCLKNGR